MTKPTLEETIAALRAVLPYALSRCEDMHQEMEDLMPNDPDAEGVPVAAVIAKREYRRASIAYDNAETILKRFDSAPVEEIMQAGRELSAALGKPKYLVEFPDFDDAEHAEKAIALGFEDQSWHQNDMPTFICDVFEIGINFVDPARREQQEARRFFMIEEGDVVLATDDWADIEAFVLEGKRDFEVRS